MKVLLPKHDRARTDYDGPDRRAKPPNDAKKTVGLSSLAALVLSSAVYNFVRVEKITEDLSKQMVEMRQAVYATQRDVGELKKVSTDAKEERQVLAEMIETLGDKQRQARVVTVTRDAPLSYVCHVGDQHSTTIKLPQEAVAMHLREHFRDYAGACR